MNELGEDSLRQYLTDFDKKLDGQLFLVRPTRVYTRTPGGTATSIHLLALVKAQYKKELMRLLSTGMILAIRNFKSRARNRFALLEISRVHPHHYGMEAITNETYYPLQHEIATKTVIDWEKVDTSTMQITVESLPIGFDLILQEEGGAVKAEFEKGWTHPVIGEKVWVLNEEAVTQMYNKKVLERMEKRVEDLFSSDPRLSPRLGTIEMFEGSTIPIFIDFQKLVRYHFGIFGYTGSGKSNLVSNIVRRIAYHTGETNTIIFDISSEYVILLLDVLTSPDVTCLVVTDRPVQTRDEFFQSLVKPDTLTPSFDMVKEKLDALLKTGRVKQLVQPREALLTYETILGALKSQDSKYQLQVAMMETEVYRFLDEKTMDPSEPIGPEGTQLADALQEIVTDAGLKFGPANIPALVGMASGRPPLLRTRLTQDQITPDDIVKATLEGVYRLVIINIADPVAIRNLVTSISYSLLQQRKQEFRLEPFVLSVFDEAQEFLPRETSRGDYTEQSSKAIETLLRHGRKYGLGGCIATQRVAHLNTNALQQLHTYFVGTLPRPYDRAVIADSFMIPNEILERTLEFQTGQWLLSSYNATGIPNVPIFIKADNAEDSLHF